MLDFQTFCLPVHMYKHFLFNKNRITEYMPYLVVCFVHLKIDHECYPMAIKAGLLNFQWLYKIAIYRHIYLTNLLLLDILPPGPLDNVY